jgi:uncharacterized phage protein gp47/JayE
MLSLETLRRPITRSQAITWLTDSVLIPLGFDTTSWADGSTQKNVLYLLATCAADMSEAIKLLAEFGVNDYSRGVALKEYSRSRFDNTQIEAVAAVGPMILTNVGSVPYTIVPGQLLAATTTGVQFRNTTGGTLSAGSLATPATLSLTFTAVKRGGSNVGSNTVTQLLTPLAGVTITNPGSPWYTTSSADQESDASLRLRNSTKWSRLTVELVAESYEAIAREAGAVKVKVNDQNPRGPGTIDVYCTASSAILGTDDMEAIQLAMSERAFQTDSEWAHPWPNDTSRVAVKHPSTHDLAIVGTVYHDANLTSAAVQAACIQALQDWLDSTPIGGWSYASGVENVVLVSDVNDVLRAVQGVRTVVLTTPAATVSINTLALVTNPGTWDITPVAVT